MATLLDIIIVFAYVACLPILGYFLGRKQGHEGYFVNNRKTKTLMLLGTTISTSVGAGTIIASTSIAYSTGIGMGIAFAIGIFFAWLLAGFLAPRIKKFGDKTKAVTLGDFFQDRYNNEVRLLVAGLLAIITFLWMAIQFVAIGNLLSILIGIDYGISLLIAAGVTIVYVAFGGLRSDFVTDAFQFWLMLIMFILLIPLGIMHIGGLGALEALPQGHFNLFNFGGPALFFGAILLAAPFSLVGMDVWQRIYSAQSVKTAKRTMFLAAFINPLFYLMAAIIGIIAAVAFTGINPDSSVFTLMNTTLPAGLLGMGMVSLLAVVMSSVDSQIVMLSAIITKDFYKGLIKPKATSKQMLKLGRFSGLIGGFIGMAIAYLIPNIVQLAILTTSVMLVLAPALLGGFFWKKATSKAAFYSIASGFAVAVTLVSLNKEKGVIPALVLGSLMFVSLSYFGKKN